ncbi:MAG: XkdX family protein [Lachnospiraceae bacterium]|nr:XkdX family protein [Lachnospiraceae bacterium]
MRTLVESLKRLYKKGKVTKKKLQEMVDAGTITQDEYNYIIG